MTSSLLGLRSDLWTGNNKDPDVMETYEQERWRKKVKKKNLQSYIFSSVWEKVGEFSFSLSLSFTYTYTHKKQGLWCLSLVFIDPGIEKWASWFSFNQTLMGISLCVRAVCACVHGHGRHGLSAHINADLSRWRTKEGTEPEAGLSNWSLV